MGVSFSTWANPAQRCARTGSESGSGGTAEARTIVAGSMESTDGRLTVGLRACQSPPTDATVESSLRPRRVVRFCCMVIGCYSAFCPTEARSHRLVRLIHGGGGMLDPGVGPLSVSRETESSAHRILNCVVEARMSNRRIRTNVSCG